MTPVAHDIQQSKKMSVTTYNFSSLYLLHSEIKEILKNAEIAIGDYNKNLQNKTALTNTADELGHLSNIFSFINLYGTEYLTEVIATGIHNLCSNKTSNKSDLILLLSEGVMTLDRYIDMVLLKEVLEPLLLLDIINQLKVAVGQLPLSINDIVPTEKPYVIIYNPSQNYTPVSDLTLDSKAMSIVFRNGLNIALSTSSNQLSAAELSKLDDMYQVVASIAKESKCLFWQASKTITQDLHTHLPLNDLTKRLLIFIEQHINNYNTPDNNKFAELVYLASTRDNPNASKLKTILKSNQLHDDQIETLKSFMFGINHTVAKHLNTLIQSEISSIKSSVNALVSQNSNNTNDSQEENQELESALIANQLTSLGATFKLLDYQQSAVALSNVAKSVKQWRNPTSDDLDNLLTELMVAENDSISLLQKHSPGSQEWHLNNKNISIYQLDTAYNNLINETRLLIKKLENSIHDFINYNELKKNSSFKILNSESSKELPYYDELLSNMPEVLKQIAGTLRFLEMTDSANVIKQLSTYLNELLKYDENDSLIYNQYTHQKFSKVALILLAIDHQLSSRQQKHPLDDYVLYLGNNSLYDLLKSA